MHTSLAYIPVLAHTRPGRRVAVRVVAVDAAQLRPRRSSLPRWRRSQPPRRGDLGQVAVEALQHLGGGAVEWGGVVVHIGVGME